MQGLSLFVFFCFIAYATAETLNLIEDYGLEEIDFESDQSDLDEVLRLRSWALIFPGTKWCGDGNIAEGYNDLGIFKDVDKCCRDHDHCEDVIPGHQTSTVHNLTNPKFYTRLNCQCDYQFLDCLEESDHLVGRKIGVLYFNILGTQCFRKDHPATCERIRFVPVRKCVEYSYDADQQKLYQWFDVSQF